MRIGLDVWVRRTRAVVAVVAGAVLVSGCASASTRGSADPTGTAGASYAISTTGSAEAGQPILRRGVRGEDGTVTALDRTGSASVSQPRAGTGVGRTVAQRGAAALASLAFPYRDLGYRVVFTAGRSGELGVTNSRDRRITIFVRPGQTDLSLRATLAHELGHALDFRYGSEDRHRRYREIRGLPGGQWYPCSRCDDFASPAGDFAEVFAASLVGTGDFRSRLAGPPSPTQLRALAELLTIPRTPATAEVGAQEQPAESAPAEEPDDGLPLGLPGG